MDKVKENASKAFSAGLGKVGQHSKKTQVVTSPRLSLTFIAYFQGGRAAAWATAIGAVIAYSWYENRDNGKVFSKEEQSTWNSQKAPETGKR